MVKAVLDKFPEIVDATAYYHNGYHDACTVVAAKDKNHELLQLLLRHGATDTTYKRHI